MSISASRRRSLWAWNSFITFISSRKCWCCSRIRCRGPLPALIISLSIRSSRSQTIFISLKTKLSLALRLEKLVALDRMLRLLSRDKIHRALSLFVSHGKFSRCGYDFTVLNRGDDSSDQNEWEASSPAKILPSGSSFAEKSAYAGLHGVVVNLLQGAQGQSQRAPPVLA